jgi:LacI family transcriptional regulator
MYQKEIAKALKVSQTSVSLVLNDPQTNRISREKRDMILSFLEKHNCQPRFNSKSSIIAYILPDTYQWRGNYKPFFDYFFKGVEVITAKNNYKIVVSTYDPGMTVMDWKNKVDGMIFESFVAEEVLEKFSSQLPVLALNLQVKKNICDVVAPNNFKGLHLAFEALLELGHKRIAYLSPRIQGMPPSNNSEERFYAFCNEYQRAGLSLNKKFIGRPVMKKQKDMNAATQEAIHKVLDSFLEMPADERPTAVICSNDYYAFELLRYASRKNLRIPESMSVIGIDNHPAGEATFPALTSINQHPEEMGEIAAETLLNRIANPQRPLCEIYAGVSLEMRESVARVSN